MQFGDVDLDNSSKVATAITTYMFLYPELSTIYLYISIIGQFVRITLPYLRLGPLQTDLTAAECYCDNISIYAAPVISTVCYCFHIN